MNKAEIEKWFWSDCPHGSVAYTSDCQQCCLDLVQAARVEGLRLVKRQSELLDWEEFAAWLDAEVAAIERGKDGK